MRDSSAPHLRKRFASLYRRLSPKMAFTRGKPWTQGTINRPPHAILTANFHPLILSHAYSLARLKCVQFARSILLPKSGTSDYDRTKGAIPSLATMDFFPLARAIRSVYPARNRTSTKHGFAGKAKQTRYNLVVAVRISKSKPKQARNWN